MYVLVKPEDGRKIDLAVVAVLLEHYSRLQKTER
jgi:hypothetical protein